VNDNSNINREFKCSFVRAVVKVRRRPLQLGFATSIFNSLV